MMIWWKSKKREFVIRPQFKPDDGRVYISDKARWRLATPLELAEEIERLILLLRDKK